MSDEVSPPPPETGGHAAAETAANPWPGLASYTESERHLFFGRSAETNEVVRLVQRETLTVLFGRSGLGKSSLLRAGVMPRLREHGFFPVTLRLDFSGRAEVSPVEQVKALTVAAARGAGIEPEGLPEDAAKLTLWEWFHAVEFWGQRNDPVTPILALDQFEEIFTLGRGLPRTNEFIEEVADLIENRVPQSVRDRAQASGERLAYDAARQDYKVILSLREDFVPRLDSLRPVLPAIMRNRFALAPLAAECACAVVLGAGGRYVSDADAREIVAAVVGGDGPLAYRPAAEVEPAYLSVMCHELFRRMQAFGRRSITRDLIDAERGGILEGLYTRSFEGIGDPVRVFVEDRLLTPSGYRGTLPLADATQEGIAEADLRTLVDRRLLRFEDRLGTIHLELSHDLLTRIVLKRRESRRAEAALRLETERAQKSRAAQLAQRRRSRVVAGVAVALAVLLVATIWGGYYCFVQEHRASYRGVVTRRGFPEGISELSAAEARRLPLRYVMVYKGLTWDGWRPRWKPAFKMMALDQRGRLTTNHGYGTFFWRAHDQAQTTELNKDLGLSLGLAAVCQWEFTADAGGGIAYARGLDRDNRMVWGCVYSPAAVGSASTRIAHYVGPDGFPQLQNTSAAEYIEIHYDADGREERLAFLDAMARPAPGPDGEFGTARRYNPSGNVTSAMALDAQGRPMIDRNGNAGLRATYTSAGLLDEIFSLGADEKPFANSDGWTRIKDHYDDLGRLTLIEAFDGERRPVVRRSNFSALRNTYDESGALALETYLGTDGQPRSIVGSVVSVKHEFDADGSEFRTSFLDAAGRPGRLRDGNCGYQSRFDSRGNLVERTLCGPDGKPFLISEGYAGWKSEFDEQGRETRRTHHGVAGEPVVVTKGFHGWEKRYDQRGNAVRQTYLGTDGRPMFTTEQVAGWEAEFDPRGRETVRNFFGAEGQPVVHADGNHGSLQVYDEHGYVAEFIYLGLDGKPATPSSSHSAIEKVQYDAQGRETRRSYYDETDKPIGGKGGFHGYAYEHDLVGNTTGVTTINLYDQPILPGSHGYARETRAYDSRAYLIGRRYYDAAGNPAKNDVGVFAVRYRYDVGGNRIEEANEDAQPGEAMLDGGGVHRVAYEYDGWGRMTKQSTFGLKGDPVAGVDDAFAKTNRYDAAGNCLETIWLDAEGKPMICKLGYARLRAAYDERNNEVELTYFDAGGQPCVCSDNTHRWTKKYNAHRNTVSWEFFDVHDRPVVGTGGYAAVMTEYDPRGDETKKTYLGPDGKPLNQATGCATVSRSYAPSGLLTLEKYDDAAGQPALSDGGYHAYSCEYDDAGRKRTVTWLGLPALTLYKTRVEKYHDGLRMSEQYFGPGGDLVDSAYGYAQMSMDYNDLRETRQITYRDASGKPAYGLYGYARAEYVGSELRHYDDHDNMLPGIDHGNMRPLLYVQFLRSVDGEAARSGLLAGDVIWRVGELAFSQVVADHWQEDETEDKIRKRLITAWRSVAFPGIQTPVRFTVIRGGKLVELVFPNGVPANGVGVFFNIRLVPALRYEGMVNRNDEQSRPAPTAP